MRISILTPPDDLSGGLRVVAIYASELQARGHEVLLVSNRHARPTWREQLRALKHGRWRALQCETRARCEPGHLAASGVPRHVLERPRAIMAADVPDGDVVIATWWETARWMQALPPTKGRKVHLLQGYEIWWGGSEARTQVQAVLRQPNLKIAISSGLKHDIEQDLGDLAIHVVNNAVDAARFDAPVRERGTPPTVGFIYAPDLIKGPDRCYRVIERLRRQLPALRVLAFGAQAPTPELPLPPDTEFHLRPAQALIPALYARCDAWLFASRVDSFGLPLLEAMACRTPVVAVPVGAAPELLGGGAGVLVEMPGEDALPDAMADALYRLLSQPAPAWQIMSQCAHQRAHAYTWSDAADRLEALLGHANAPVLHETSGETPCGPNTVSV